MLTPAPFPVVPIIVIAGISLALCWLGVLLAGLRLSGSLNERILVIGGGPLALRLIDEVAGHPSWTTRRMDGRLLRPGSGR
jgi:hypothetical protein